MAMPRNVRKTKSTTTRHRTKARSSARGHRVHRRPVPEQIGAAAGRVTESAVTELLRRVVPNTVVPVAHVEAASHSGLLDAAARIAGGALAFSSILITAPMMFLVQAYMMSRDSNDLKSREYRDDAGRLHHHTRTFMRDQAGELQAPAA
jgi:hypothetical protein